MRIFCSFLFSFSLFSFLSLFFFLGDVGGEGLEKIQVHVVPHSHADPGWVKTVDQYFMGLNMSITKLGGVQYILDSIYRSLMEEEERKFHQVEISFFSRWWSQQKPEVKRNMKQLVRNGQLEFSSGGWVMHDEATSLYIDVIDQMTVGHSFIQENFGYDAIPSVAWQIDPFGHSASQPTYFTHGFGFNGVIFGRIDYQDLQNRINEKKTELVWRPSPSLENQKVFTSCDLGGNYQPPVGLCFDQVCQDDAVQDDTNLQDYNVEERVETFVEAAINQAQIIDGKHIIFKMGSDFHYENGNMWYKNLDKLIQEVNQDGRVHAFYSTPRLYVESKKDRFWEVKTDDFFPYADWPTWLGAGRGYWSGFYTSRPNFKYFVRYSSSLLHTAKQLVFGANLNKKVLSSLERAVALVQHHDAITGTSKQHVIYDYEQRLSLGLDHAGKEIKNAFSSLTGVSLSDLSSCPLANISVCEATKTLSPFSVWIYNPRAQPLEGQLVRIPIPHQNYEVLDHENRTVPSSVIEIARTNSLTEESQPFNIYFAPTVPGTGWVVYKIQENRGLFYSDDRNDDVRNDDVRNDDLCISNDHYSVCVDDNGFIEKITNIESGLESQFHENYLYYHSYVSADDGQNSGVYIFRPEEDTPPIKIEGETSFVTKKTDQVQEIQTNVNNWVQRTVRILEGSPFFELEYSIGPVPVDFPVGKELIVRFGTDIKNRKIMFTDANGREMQERRYNYRPTFDLDVFEPVAGNYYPVTTAAFISDKWKQLSFNVDRPQGAASLRNGEIEFMLQRRILKDDARGVQEPLNETAGITPYPNPIFLGFGINTTITHRISLESPATFISPNGNEMFRNIFSNIYRHPQIFFSSVSEKVPSEGQILGGELPPQIELETLSFHPVENGALLRLGHNMAINESPLSVPVTVDISALFLPRFRVTKIEEKTLSGMPIRSMIDWKTLSGVQRNQNVTSVKGIRKDFTTVISPMEIQTFFVSFVRVE